MAQKKRNLCFEISKKDFIDITSKNCFYCGVEPKQIFINPYGNGNYIFNGIDRTDSSIGYTIENCVPCCGRCNEAKMKESKSDFLSWVKRVYEHLNLGG